VTSGNGSGPRRFFRAPLHFGLRHTSGSAILVSISNQAAVLLMETKEVSRSAALKSLLLLLILP